MTPVELRRRRAGPRAADRRRPGGGEGPRASQRPGADAPLSLFGDGGARSAVAPVGREEVAIVRPVGPAPADGGERGTLAELVARLWEEVIAEGRTACPLCGGEIMGRASAHARPTEGRCRECGTTIA